MLGNVSTYKNVLSFNVNAKEAKTAHHVKLEEALLTCFKGVSAAGVNIDGKVFREKADEIALTLRIDGFQAFCSWLHILKRGTIFITKASVAKGKRLASQS